MSIKYTYSLERADEIIKEWEPKLKGIEYVSNGQILSIKNLYKEALGSKFMVMVGTGTPLTDELNSVLFSRGEIINAII